MGSSNSIDASCRRSQTPKQTTSQLFNKLLIIFQRLLKVSKRSLTSFDSTILMKLDLFGLIGIGERVGEREKLEAGMRLSCKQLRRELGNLCRDERFENSRQTKYRRSLCNK